MTAAGAALLPREKFLDASDKKLKPRGDRRGDSKIPCEISFRIIIIIIQTIRTQTKETYCHLCLTARSVTYDIIDQKSPVSNIS